VDQDPWHPGASEPIVAKSRQRAAELALEWAQARGPLFFHEPTSERWLAVLRDGAGRRLSEKLTNTEAEARAFITAERRRLQQSIQDLAAWVAHLDDHGHESVERCL
jgi:hypothetical protein